MSDMFKGVILKIMFISVVIGGMVFFTEQFWSFRNISKGRDLLDRDAYLLQQILEDENCLSADVIGGESQYSRFVNDVLRNSETDVFKYDIEVAGSGRIKANSALGNNGWSGINDAGNPLRVDYTSYTTAPQRGEIVTASLTMTVYSPALTGRNYADDTFSRTNKRIRTEITKEIKVIGRKYYKGKAS